MLAPGGPTSTRCSSAGTGPTTTPSTSSAWRGRTGGLPLVERKRRLRAIMPRGERHRLRFVDSITGCGCDLFRLACEHDTEGIVAKWAEGRYHTDGVTTSWPKVKNRAYTGSEGRHEPFAGRTSSRVRTSPKPYRLDPTVARLT